MSDRLFDELLGELLSIRNHFAERDVNTDISILQLLMGSRAYARLFMTQQLSRMAIVSGRNRATIAGFEIIEIKDLPLDSINVVVDHQHFASLRMEA